MKIEGANGTLTLPLGWRGLWKTLTIHGGPFTAYDKGLSANKIIETEWLSVCLKEHGAQNADIHVPIEDFRTPESDEQVTGAIIEILRHALAGREVFVGCMGGWGRTGLFLAVLAKAVGIEDPVAYVRSTYTDKAVETKQQEHYVARFDVAPIQTWLFGWGINRVMTRGPLAFWE